MARSTLTVIELNTDGSVLAGDMMGDAWADGFAIMNDGDKRTFFMCKNESGGPITLTIQTAAMLDGLPVADRTYVIEDGQRLIVGAFKPSVYNRPDGTIWVDFSSAAGVTFGAFKLAG